MLTTYVWPEMILIYLAYSNSVYECLLLLSYTLLDSSTTSLENTISITIYLLCETLRRRLICPASNLQTSRSYPIRFQLRSGRAPKRSSLVVQLRPWIRIATVLWSRVETSSCWSKWESDRVCFIWLGGVFMESSDLDKWLSKTGGVFGGTLDSFGFGSTIVTFAGLHARKTPRGSPEIWSKLGRESSVSHHHPNVSPCHQHCYAHLRDTLQQSMKTWAVLNLMGSSI
jgi:hypothetical protein